MAPRKVAAPISYPAKQRSVYQYTNLSGPTSTNIKLDHTAPNLHSTYTEWYEGEHYGMFVELDLHDAQKAKKVIIGGYKSLGEASNAMKMCAQAYLTKYPSARLMERSIELADEKGFVQQRYAIVKGRWQNTEFVKDDDYLEPEEEMRSFPPFVDDEAHVLTLPRPSVSPARYDAPVSVTLDKPEESAPAQSWCTCHTQDDGSLMICCENSDCTIQWYHARCVGIKKRPVHAWWCPTCAPVHVPSSTQPVKKGRQPRPAKRDIKTTGKEKGEKKPKKG
jgi:hypothetical protein